MCVKFKLTDYVENLFTDLGHEICGAPLSILSTEHVKNLGLSTCQIHMPTMDPLDSTQMHD